VIFFIEAYAISGGMTGWPLLLVLLWPSSLLLMAADCINGTWVDRWIIVFGTALGLNIVLYAIIGLITWPLYRRLRTRPHDVNLQ
jgi:hypothetical protein